MKVLASYTEQRLEDYPDVPTLKEKGYDLVYGSARAQMCIRDRIDTLFNNLYGLIMGKIYNEELLGIYNRGDQFPKLIVNNLGAAIQAVLLPAFSSRQGEAAEVRSMVRRACLLYTSRWSGIPAWSAPHTR